ncbi:LysR family transcriptional regulator [bacterium]|nr:LysR family transcriptional regulator [bacterium]
MHWLNYHHLYYFWHIAKSGSITAACKILKLAQPTLSAQLKSFEDSLGEPVFDRVGRNLVLTETGTIVFKYAEQIFALGNELIDVVEGKSIIRTEHLRIGIADVVPKHLAYKVISPILKLDPTPKITCSEDNSEKLLAALAIQELDIVLADSPLPPSTRVRAYNHLAHEATVSFVATKSLAEKHRRNFPRSLNHCPILLPSQNSVLRRELTIFFENQNITPHIAAEFDDSALMKIFGANGLGALPIPSSVEKDVCKEFNLKLVGRIESIKERLYLISLERRIKSPIVNLMLQSANKT